MTEQAEPFDLYRAGPKNAADLMKTSLESAERLRAEISSARTLDELLAAPESRRRRAVRAGPVAVERLAVGGEREPRREGRAAYGLM
jgi:hypothetical protein